jgi:type IV pilus assembly protein PilP
MIYLRKSVWVVLLAGVLACGEEPPPAPQPVNQKIAVQQAAMPSAATPTPAPTSSPVTVQATPGPLGTSHAPAPAPASLQAPGNASLQVEKVSSDGATVQSAPILEAAATEPLAIHPNDPASESATPAPPAAGGEASSLVKESMRLAAAYDAVGRFDPFEPLFKEQQQPQSISSSKDKRSKRVAQTPLEKVALAQLKVTAIIRAVSGNRALVEDATGKGYVVQVGTYMGLNAGQVTRIDNDRVVVEEEIENLTGELTVENQELKLQKPAGEL